MSSRIESQSTPLYINDLRVDLPSLKNAVMKYLAKQKMPPAEYQFNLETLQSVSWKPDVRSIVLSHLTFPEMQQLFLCDMTTASDEELYRILARATLFDVRAGLMNLFLSRLPPHRALELASRFTWNKFQQISFAMNMTNERNASRYSISDLKTILGPELFTPGNCEKLKTAFMMLNTSSAIALFNSCEWEQHEIPLFIRSLLLNTDCRHEHLVEDFASLVVRANSPSSRLEVVEMLCNYPELSSKDAVDLFNQFTWEQDAIFHFVQYMLTTCQHRSGCQMNDFVQLIKKLHSPSNQLHLLSLLGTSIRFIDSLYENPDALDLIALLPEESRAELAITLASHRPLAFLKHFSLFGISQDHFKAKILTILLQTTPTLSHEQLALLQFSSAASLTEALKKAVETNVPAAYHFMTHTEDLSLITHTEDLSLIQTCLLITAREYGFDERAIQKRCFAPLAKVRAQRDKIRALQWLVDTLEQLYRECDHHNHEILRHDQTSRILSSLMLFRNPTLRQRMKIAYFKIVSNPANWQRYIQKTPRRPDAERHAKLYRPMQQLLKNSPAPKEATQKLLTHIQGHDMRAPQPVDLSAFSSTERAGICRVYQNYRAYTDLLSPENFDSQLLNPILRVLQEVPTDSTSKTRLSQQCKEQLCHLVDKPQKFENWLSELQLPPPLSKKISTIFQNFHDAPQKFDFQLIQLYCVLLQSELYGNNTPIPTLVDNFGSSISTTFDLHYFALIEALDLLHSSIFTDSEKELVLQKLFTLFSKADRTVPSQHNVASELHAFIALAIYIGQVSGAEVMISETEILALLSAEKFSLSAATAAANMLDLSWDTETLEAFQSNFIGDQMGGAFLTFIAKLKTLRDEQVMDGLRKVLTSVLNNTYAADRNAPENSSQLRAAAEIDPSAVERWKNIQYSYNFTLENTPHFDPIEWFESITYLDGIDPVAINATLKGISPQISPFDEALLHLSRAHTRELQIECLQNLRRHSSNKMLNREIDKVLSRITRKKEIVYAIQTTTDPKEIFLLGTKFYGSCQNLGGTPNNTKCLVGFFDGKYLPITITKEGSSIARALLILAPTMEADGKQSLALYLELFYTNELDPRLILEIEKLASKIQKEMGYPVIKGSKTKYPEGFYQPAELPSYSRGTPYLGQVISHRNGWNPFEFSDALAIQAGVADSGITDGRFVLSGDTEYLPMSDPEAILSSSQCTSSSSGASGN